MPLHPDAIEAEKADIVARYEPWTAHKIHLAGGCGTGPRGRQRRRHRGPRGESRARHVIDGGHQPAVFQGAGDAHPAIRAELERTNRGAGGAECGRRIVRSKCPRMKAESFPAMTSDPSSVKWPAVFPGS